MAVRSEILNPGVITKYVEGVKALKKSGDYDKFIEAHYKVMDKVHATPTFLPWHRAFLEAFEQKLQAAVGNPEFGLPYWDWAGDAGDVNNRGALWTDAYLGGAGSPVKDGPFTAKDWSIYLPPKIEGPASLTRELGGSGTFPTSTKTQELFVQATYDGFRRVLEGQLRGFHDWLHVWVGGTSGHMSSVPISPNDPAFWLLHCNVDRIWAQWQRVRPTVKTEAPGFAGFGPEMMMPATFDGTGARTVGSVLADASTVYSYDHYYGNSKPMVIKFWTGNTFMAGTNDKVTFTIEVRVDGVPGVLAIWSAYLDPKLCDHADPFETGQVDTFTIPNVGFKPWGMDKDLAGKLTPVCFSTVTIQKKPNPWDPRGDWHLLKFQLNSDGATWTSTVNKVLTEASASVVVKLGPPKF